jgi:acetyltransferase-like isoleucine patch superfamily enzyme
MISRLVDAAYARAVAFLGRLEDRRVKNTLHACGRNVKLYHPIVFYGAEALDIGDNTSIAPYVHIWCGGRVIIGANCMIGSHVAISSLTHDYREPDMSRTIVAKPVVIGDGVWIGAHAVIMPGVTVGNGAVVGAGSVVTRDVPGNAIAHGVPARVSRYRDADGG